MNLRGNNFNRHRNFLVTYTIFFTLFLGGRLLNRYKYLRREYESIREMETSELGISGDILKALMWEHKNAVFLFILILPYNCVERLYIKELEEEGMRDALTGVYLRKKIEGIVPIIRRNPGTGWLLLYIDLDELKKINDTRGHRAGDKYIVDFTRVISSVIREEDYFLRMGGDEFLILLRGVEEENRLRIIQRFYNLREKCNIEFSVGESLFKGRENFDDSDLEHLILKAEQKMYEDKHSRKKLRVKAKIRA